MKKHVQKERISLSILYAAVVFCVQLVSLLITTGLYRLLDSMEALTPLWVSSDDVETLLLFMVLVSVVIGIIITFLTRRIPMNPFNRIINNMNRLASGDFKARLEFGKPIKNHPAFAELSESFNTMARELEHTELFRNDFINNFSHEFKTPIVSIAGFAKLLRRGNLTEAQKAEYLAIIEEESLRLSAMATNVLALTKVENQTILSEITTFNLSEQIRSCVLLLEEAWSRKELTLDLEFAEYTISADEELLKQVWINLLDNACKFSPPTGEISVQIKETGGMVEVLVKNYGSEIPAEKQRKIWSKFYQADESHASKGNGIGLAVVKYIVELHKGSASVTSENGVTTFAVRIPKSQKPEGVPI